MKNRINDLVIKGNILNWDEGIPLGNALCGCMIWEKEEKVRFSLDRGDLWDNRINPIIYDKDFSYTDLINLVREKEHKKVLAKYREYCGVYPTKIPCGAIEIDPGTKLTCIENRLSLEQAYSKQIFRIGNEDMIIESYLHATHKTGHIRIKGYMDKPGIKIIAPAYVKEDNSDALGDDVSQLGYPGPEFGGDGVLEWYRQRGAEGLEYAILIASRQTLDGTLELSYIIAANTDGSGWFEEAKEKLGKALGCSWEETLESHHSWWKQFWDKSSISVPDRQLNDAWYLMNYFLGAASGKGSPPIALQGVWTQDNGKLPPWRGDYHNDLNTQLTYWSYLKANRLEQGESYLDFLTNLIPAAKAHAKRFFDADGISFPSVMSLDGKPIGGYTQYCFSITNHLWVCQSFDHYWRYTGDDDFLRESAYPFFTESAACLIRWLVEEDGKLKLPLSCSPEIHEDSYAAWLTPNSNYDLSLMMYLFETLADMAIYMGLKEDADKWQGYREKLPELAVNEKNVLMLSPDESLRESHRHLSHAMAIYPLCLLDYINEKDKKIIDATVYNLELLGKGLWCGYTYPWMACIYAIQGSGTAAAFSLKLFLDCYCSKNGFHLNFDFKKTGIGCVHFLQPFTIEGNLAYANALQEMLLQNQKAQIRLFPAIPEEWKEEGASFENFLAGRGLLVSAEIRGGGVNYVRLYAQKAGTWEIIDPFDTNVGMDVNGDYSSIKRENGMIYISLQAGNRCELKEKEV